MHIKGRGGRIYVPSRGMVPLSDVHFNDICILTINQRNKAGNKATKLCKI